MLTTKNICMCTCVPVLSVFHFICFSPLTNLRPYNIWNTHMHPRKLTWTPKLPMLEGRFLFQIIIFMGFLGLVSLWYSTRAIHSWISATTSRISARSSKALSHCKASCSTGHLLGLVWRKFGIQSNAAKAWNCCSVHHVLGFKKAFQNRFSGVMYANQSMAFSPNLIPKEGFVQLRTIHGVFFQPEFATVRFREGRTTNTTLWCSSYRWMSCCVFLWYK